MAKRGAKPKYESCVAPYLEEISKKIRQGVIEAEIAKSLGISVASLNNYKKQHPELANALSKDKGADVLQSLINAGIEAAKGCYKTNTKTIYVMSEEGKPIVAKIEEVEQWQPPNPALNKFYVQNFGKDEGYTSEPLEYALRKAKQEFMQKLEKSKNWDIDIED